MNIKSNKIDNVSTKRLFLRIFIGIFFVCILSIIVSLVWLKKGIVVENINNKALNINRLYLKLDYKLLIKIDKLDIILANQKTETKQKSKNPNIDLSLLTYLYDFIQSIQIDSLNIANKSYKVDFEKNYLQIRHDKTLISSNFIATSDALYINTSLNNLPNIRFVKDFVRLDPLIEEWMYDNVSPSRLSATILTKIDNDGSFDFDYLKAYGIIHNPKLTYHKELVPLKAKYAKVELKNGKLSFDLISPTYKDIVLNSAIASLSDIIFLNHPVLDIKLDIDHQINQTPFEILRAYDIELFEIEQLKGKSHVKVDLSIDLMRSKLDYKASIISKKPTLKLLGLVVDCGDLKIDINNNKIDIKTDKINYHNTIFLEPKNITFDTNNLLLKTNFYVTDSKNIAKSQANLKLNFNDNLGKLYVDVDELNFDKFITISPKDKFQLSASLVLAENMNKLIIKDATHDIDFKYDFNKSLMDMQIVDIETIRRHSDYLQEYNIDKADFNITSSDFVDFKIYSNIFDLDIPVYSNNERWKDISFVTTIEDNITTLFHKNFIAKFDKNDVNINLKNLDFVLLDKDINNTNNNSDKNIQINSYQCSLTYHTHKLISDRAVININKGILKATSHKDDSKFEFYKKSNKYYFKADDFNDNLMNNLVNKDMFKGGRMSFVGYQRDGKVSGALDMNKTTIKNVKLFNNLFAFINTAPAIINPLLAIPNLLSTKNLGFSTSGYKLDSGEVLFEYDINRSFAKMSAIDLKADSADIEGTGILDFENNNLDMGLNVSFMKTYSSVISKIPLVGYIMLGKNGTISLNLDAKGKIENPKLNTHLVKDTSKLPFKMTKRILLSPFELLGFDVDNEKD